MDIATFTTVLGQPQILVGSLTDARRRVLAHDGDVIVGVAVLEPLYGRQAEGVIAVAPGSSGGVISYLYDGLLELARRSGVTVLRYGLGPGRQRALAAELAQSRGAGRSLRSDRLELHLEPAGDGRARAVAGRL